MQSFILFENTYVLGIIGVFVFTVFLIIILQYKTIVGIFKTKKSKEPSQKCSKLSKTDHDKPSHIADYYTPDQIEEIRRCAIKLHKYSPHEEIGAGEPAGLNEREQLRKRTFSLIKKESQVSDHGSSNDGDSMLVNLPCDNDQDDVTMDDLTPDDITLSDDEDDINEDEAHISPQAIADIEAELLDSSILNESVDSNNSNLEIDESEKKLVCVMEETLQVVVDPIVIKLCMESLVEVILCDEDKHEEQLDIDDSNLQYIEDNLKKLENISFHFNEDSGEVEFISSQDLNQQDLRCNSHNLSQLVNDVESNEVVRIESNSLNIDDVSCLPGPSSSSYLNDGCFVSLEQLETNNCVNNNMTDYSPHQQSATLTNLLATELIARYLARKCVCDSLEECRILLEKEDKLSHLDQKLNKISKIQSEKSKLTQEQLAEEQRIQESQLSEILALMERNPHMFGNATKEGMTEQASLYCV